MYFYARNFKAMPLIGNITVATLTGFCFVIAGVVIACATSSLKILFISIYLGLFAVFMTLAREIVKDMEDIEGDKKEGARTFPILYGKKIPSIISIILIVVTTLMCPILYIFKIFNIWYMVIMIVPIIIFLYSAYSLKLNPPEETCAKVSKNLKDTSDKFPIGVATKYNVACCVSKLFCLFIDFLSKHFSYFIAIRTILVVCI